MKLTYQTSFKSPTFLHSTTGVKMPDTSGWQTRHIEALYVPKGFEAAIVNMISSWAAYADVHHSRYESDIGQDGVLGVEWFAIGRAILGLLNGELGRLDGGTLDRFIRDTLQSEGFDSDE